MKKRFEDYIQKSIKENPSLKDELSKAIRALEIGERLKNLRVQKGFTQKKLASLIEVSQSNIARIENANYDGYSIQTLLKVAEGLGADLNITLDTEKKLSETQISNTSLSEPTEINRYTSSVYISYKLLEKPSFSSEEWKYPEDEKTEDNLTATIVSPNSLMNCHYLIA